MSAYTQDSGYNQRRMMVLLAIVVLHLFIGWAFVSGFGKAAIARITKDVQVSLIKEEKPKDLPPPPPKPDLLPPPPVSVPPPLVNINIPVDAPPIVTTTKPPPVAAPRPVAIVPETGVKFARKVDPDEYYPDRSRTLNEEGPVSVQVCVGPDGKLDGTPEVVTTSGFPRLDEAAMKYARESRYKAAISGGKAVRACTKYVVRFRLKKE